MFSIFKRNVKKEKSMIERPSQELLEAKKARMEMINIALADAAKRPNFYLQGLREGEHARVLNALEQLRQERAILVIEINALGAYLSA